MHPSLPTCPRFTLAQTCIRHLPDLITTHSRTLVLPALIPCRFQPKPRYGHRYNHRYKHKYHRNLKQARTISANHSPTTNTKPSTIIIIIVLLATVRLQPQPSPTTTLIIYPRSSNSNNNNTRRLLPITTIIPNIHYPHTITGLVCSTIRSSNHDSNHSSNRNYNIRSRINQATTRKLHPTTHIPIRPHRRATSRQSKALHSTNNGNNSHSSHHR